MDNVAGGPPARPIESSTHAKRRICEARRG
jgi:hypothetical protein